MLWRLSVLTVASWVFVGWFDWRFVPIMVGTTTIDWIAGQLLVRGDTTTRRRRILALVLAAYVASLDAGAGLPGAQGHIGLRAARPRLPR